MHTAFSFVSITVNAKYTVLIHIFPNYVAFSTFCSQAVPADINGLWCPGKAFDKSKKIGANIGVTKSNELFSFPSQSLKTGTS